MPVLPLPLPLERCTKGSLHLQRRERDWRGGREGLASGADQSEAPFTLSALVARRAAVAAAVIALTSRKDRRLRRT